MNFVISKEPEVQVIQRLLRAILRGFKIAGDAGCGTELVSSALCSKGLSDDKASMLIESLVEQGMLRNTGSQLYAVSTQGHDFLSALEEAYASGELPPAPPLITH